MLKWEEDFIEVPSSATEEQVVAYAKAVEDAIEAEEAESRRR